MAMSLAILGAKGMLGQAVAEAAARSPAFGVMAALDLPDVDITDPECLRSRDGLARADVWINCAAYTDVEKAEAEEAVATRINGEGVAHLARFAAETGALLAHVSTDFVFDGQSQVPYGPDDPPAPISAYGRSKLAGEQALQNSAAKWLLVRTSWLFGLGGRNFVETILARAEQGGGLAVVDDQVGSPTYAADLAQALLGLAAGRATGIFHYTNAGACTWRHFAEEILWRAGREQGVEPLTSEEAAETFGLVAARPAFSVLDCAATDEILPFPRRSWQDALAAYLQARSVATGD